MSEQEIVFAPKDHQGPQAGLDSDDPGHGNSNRVSSDQALAGDQHRSRDSRGSGGGRDTDNEFGSNDCGGDGNGVSTGSERSSHDGGGR